MSNLYEVGSVTASAIRRFSARHWREHCGTRLCEAARDRGFMMGPLLKDQRENRVSEISARGSRRTAKYFCRICAQLKIQNKIIGAALHILDKTVVQCPLGLAGRVSPHPPIREMDDPRFVPFNERVKEIYEARG